MRRQAGFSLLELLIAMAVTAVIVALSYVAIDRSVAVWQRFLPQQADLIARQRALWRLGEDLMQMAPRPVRDAFGLLRPALSWRDQTLTLTKLALTEGPSGRPGTERVSWRLDHGHLQRGQWLAVDGGPVDRIRWLDMFSGVRSWQVSFWDGRQWQLQWPPLESETGAPKLAALPRLVRVELVLQDGRRLVRIWPGAGG